LFAQLEHLDEIQAKRRALWDRYHQHLAPLADADKLRVPRVPGYATNNAHMYYVVCRNLRERTGLIAHLKERGVYAVFHYLSLHKSPFYGPLHDGRELPWSDFYTDCLVRLPMYYELEPGDVDRVAEAVNEFFAR
jgi:dTDP-4-amino-4,6-dideoxygalactose transaminase